MWTKFVTDIFNTLRPFEFSSFALEHPFLSQIKVLPLQIIWYFNCWHSNAYKTIYVFFLSFSRQAQTALPTFVILPQSQESSPDHVQVQGLSCCCPTELLSFLLPWGALTVLKHVKWYFIVREKTALRWGLQKKLFFSVVYLIWLSMVTTSCNRITKSGLLDQSKWRILVSTSWPYT